MNKLDPKYKKGDKFVVEIAEVHTHWSDDGRPFSMYRIKGFASLVFNDHGLDILKGQAEESQDE